MTGSSLTPFCFRHLSKKESFLDFHGEVTTGSVLESMSHAEESASWAPEFLSTVSKKSLMLPAFLAFDWLLDESVPKFRFAASDILAECRPTGHSLGDLSSALRLVVHWLALFEQDAVKNCFSEVSLPLEESSNLLPDIPRVTTGGDLEKSEAVYSSVCF